MKLSVVFIFLG